MTTLTWPTEQTRYTSKVPTDQYRSNWDKIFGKDKPEQPKEEEKK